MRNLKVALAAACAVVVGWAFTASADISASAYVQNGLVVQYDGAAALTEGGKLKNLGSSGSAFDLTPITPTTKDYVANDWIHTETGWWMPTAATSAVLGTGYTVEYYGQQTGSGETAATYFYAVGSSQTESSNSSGENAPFRIGSKGKDSKEMCIAATTAAWSSNANSLKPTGALKSSDAATRTGTIDVGTKTITYYENGTNLASAANAGTVNSGIKRINLGDLRAKRGCYWVGDIRSVRVYNRELTPDEVAVNTNIDKIRFEGVDPASLTWPAGYCWNAEKACIEYQVSVQGTDGVPVSIDGETYAESVATDWTELGTPVTVTVTAQVPQSSSVTWEGVPAGASAVRSRNSITLTLSEAATLRAVARACATFHWHGTTDALASKPANWVDSDGNVATSAPQNGDAIVLDAASADKPMTWDLDVVVGSWTQTADYTGTVTFQTGISRIANNVNQTAHGVLAEDGVTRVLRVWGDVVLNGGKWTHTANPKTAQTEPSYTDGKGIYRVIVDADGDFTLGEHATIDVSSCGYPNSNGPGYPNDHNTDNRQGACHGGTGGVGATGFSFSYGSFCAADTLGSGNSSAGGGAVVIKAGGAATFGGRIAADAAASTGWYAGAGGAISVQAQSIASAATSVLSADGGPAANGKGGGGGRIALRLTGDGDFSNCLGVLRAAGRKEKDSPSNCGTGGTIYKELASDGVGGGELTFDGIYLDDPVYTKYLGYDRRIYTLVTGVDLTYRPKKIIARNGANFGVANGDTWDLSETTAFEAIEPTGYRNRIQLDGGWLVLPERIWTEMDFFVTAASGLRIKSDGSGVLKLGAGVTFTSDFPLTVEGSVEMLSGATMTHTANGSSKDYGIDLTVTRSVTNHVGGSISAKGKGFGGNTGPGKPNTFDAEVGGNANRGASHAGLANKEIGDICYGSPTRPETMGSGGQSYSGGGTVRMTVAGELVNDGEIQANGPTVSYHAGAGGSVWVTAGRISGTGAITANGGTTTNDSWPTTGGGGRVAVWLTDPDADFSQCDVTRIAAFGGDLKQVIRSAAGTVYLKTGAQAEDEGTLVIANSNAVAVTRYQTEIGSDMETVRVGSVVIRDAGRLRIRPGHRIEVSGDWTNAGGSLQADAGSVVELVTAADAHIVGTNTFDTLVCTVGGKKLSFGTTGTKTAIAANGKLVLNGEEGNLLELKGDTADASWLLAAGTGADVSDLKFLKVAHSDATEVGQNLVANKSVDGGGNSENWKFSNVQPGDPIAWTGAADGNWANGLNWDPERPPVETDVVTIPSGCDRYPTLTSSLTLNSLTVAEGATLTLAGNAVTVTNALTVAGICAAGASDLFVVAGDVDLRGGTYVGRLTLSGANAQRVSAGVSRLAEVTVEKSGGLVGWDNGLTADKLRVSVTAPLMMTFAAGKTVTLKELRMDGAIGAAVGLILAASGEGQWKLKVSDSERVSGVAVANCDATGGLVIHGDAPYGDNGNNANWVFGNAAAIWQGGASGDFMAPGNWSTGQVPGKDDRVIIDTGAVTLGEAVEIAQLTVGGGETAASLKATAELTVGGGAEVRNGGTLSLNAPSSVGGSLFVRNGGTLTHEANGNAETYKLDLTVAENVTVEAGGAIDVTGKGYAAYQGPGCANGNSASSYAGRGANGNQPDKVKPCYGSILHPFRLGSGGMKDQYGRISSGGGAVKLTVGGALTVDGGVVADGSYSGQMYYSATGGSIWLTAPRLIGSGVIRANGTPVTSFCPGSGGRVALYQTVATDLSASQVTLQARGGYKDTGSTTDYKPHAAGGTIYVKNAGDEFGTVILEDGNGVENDQPDTLPFATDIPVTVEGDSAKAYKEMNFEVSAGGVLSLTADCTINDLVLGTNAKVRLNDHTLTILSPAHRRGRGWDAQRSIDLGANGQGKIVWPCGLMLFVK